MAKADKQERIDFVISRITKGESRGEVLSKFVKKWQTSDRTFDRCWKIANNQHLGDRQAIKEEVAKDKVVIALKAEHEAIMTASERKLILSQIAKGEVNIPTKEVRWNSSTKKFETIDFVELPSHTARISAIAEMNKMEGEYAPTKNEHSGPNGKPIETNNTSIIVKTTLKLN